jgi:hypothetical protein
MLARRKNMGEPFRAGADPKNSYPPPGTRPNGSPTPTAARPDCRSAPCEEASTVYFQPSYWSANTAWPTKIPLMLMSTRYVPMPNEEAARL